MQASHLPVWRLVALSYADIWRALRAMPLLFGCAVLIALAAGIADDWLPESGPVYGTLTGIAESAAQYFCLTPVMIAFHRFIVRGDVTRSYAIDLAEPAFLLFFAWTMAISTLFSLILTFGAALTTTVSATGQSPLAILVLTAIALIAALWLFLRLIVLFPAIAVGTPGARAGNALADTKRHDVRLFAIFVLAFIPMVAVAILVTLGLGRGIMRHHSALWLADRIVGAVVGSVVEILGVVIASHIYLAIGRKVRG